MAIDFFNIPIPPSNIQKALNRFVIKTIFTTRAGLPATIEYAGTSFTTTARAATMAPCPMVTPPLISES